MKINNGKKNRNRIKILKLVLFSVSQIKHVKIARG